MRTHSQKALLLTGTYQKQFSRIYTSPGGIDVKFNFHCLDSVSQRVISDECGAVTKVTPHFQRQFTLRAVDIFFGFEYLFLFVLLRQSKEDKRKSSSS